METVFMSAGIMTSIILCLVGLIKLPFKKFKEKHPKTFKAIFTILSIILTFGACLINQAFILVKPLFNIEFFIMLATTFAGVFGLYLSYEGLGAKELVKKLFISIKEAAVKAPESKFKKCLDKIDIDLASKILTEKKEEIAKKAEEKAVEVKEVKEEIVFTNDMTAVDTPIVIKGE